MESIKVSIVTVCLNSAKTIEQTIQSVIDQSYKNIEYIIIDGGSTDGTLNIIRKYEKHISYWVSEPDNGIYDAMNKGVLNSTGNIIGIINSDDWYEKDAIQTVVKFWEKNPETQCSYGNYTSVGIKGYEKHYEEFVEPIVFFFPHPTVFVRNDVYKKIGLYDTRFKICADSDFMFRCQCAGIKFSYINANLAFFRLAGLSQSVGSGSLFRELRASLKVLNKKGLLTPEQIEYARFRLRYEKIVRVVNYLVVGRLIRYGRHGDFLRLLLGRKQKRGYVIWGAGAAATEILNLFIGYEWMLYVFVDQDPEKQKYRVNSKRILSPNEIDLKSYYVFVSSHKYEQEICEELSSMGLHAHRDYLSYSSLFKELMLYLYDC